MSRRRFDIKPVTEVRLEVSALIRDALKAKGYKITHEVWDGPTQTESFRVTYRGVETLVLVADPSYMDEPE